jgi:hypothetical protein
MFGPYTNESCKGEGYVAPPDKEPQDLLVQLVLSGVLGVSATITFCVCSGPPRTTNGAVTNHGVDFASAMAVVVRCAQAPSRADH